jgi:hypothetical protein
MEWELRSACAGDVEAIAELRAVVMRADLERLGRFDPDLRGSVARRLYGRHGFTVESQDPVDVFMVRRPGGAKLDVIDIAGPRRKA